MSHLHVPDGVLPWWIIIVGWLVAAGFLAIAVRRLSVGEVQRKVPLLGVAAAMMVIGMSLEIVPIAYHVNLAVLAGILLGPALGFVAAFLVNVITALVGHGGVTVIGLNTLVIGVEPAFGWVLFRGFSRLAGRFAGAGWLAAAATVLTLLVSTSMMIGVIALSQVNPGIQLEEDGETPTIGFRNPLTSGVLRLELFAEAEHEEAEHEDAPRVSLRTFAAVVLFLGFWGWLLEAAVTGLIVRYLAHVRPDLVPAPARGKG